MKKLIMFVFTAAAIAVGCTKEPTPELSFDKSIYPLLADGSVEVTVSSSVAPASDLSVGIVFAGTAIKGTDYSVSAEKVVIAAGKKSGSLTITTKDNFSTSNIELSLSLPAGYVNGSVSSAKVTVDAKEKIIYSFDASEATVLDSYTIKINLKGVTSGDAFKASEQMEIPAKFTGDVESIKAEKKVFVVEKGSNVATLKISAEELEFGDSKEVNVAVDAENAGARYVEGEVKSSKLNVTGALTLKKLVGTWTFDSVFDVEDLTYFFEEEGDDPDLLPLNNTGFSFTISEVKDGDEVTGYKFTPSTTGDFAAYFRECEISYSAPVNPCDDYEQVGPYSTIEDNMFVAAIREDSQYNTYFALSKANIRFSTSETEIKTGVISLYLTAEGELIMSFHVMSYPPFGQVGWWDEDSFDADMFGFASLFTKAQ